MLFVSVVFLAIGYWAGNISSRSSSAVPSIAITPGQASEGLSLLIENEEWNALPAGSEVYGAEGNVMGVIKNDLVSVTVFLAVVNHDRKKQEFHLPAVLVGNNGSRFGSLRLGGVTSRGAKISSDKGIFMKAGQSIVVELTSTFKDYKELYEAQPLVVNISQHDMKFDLKPMPSWKFLCEKRDEKSPKSSSGKPSKSEGSTHVNGMTWVSINDPGITGHEGFTGEMSKYETTNAQYCQFLNAALASGDLTVGADNIVYGADNANSGADFVGKVYFKTATVSSYSQIAYSGGSFSVVTRDGYDMGNHPVVMVSWYGATAFCNYYGLRLPTQWEWQAVADYDGTYTYGCGTTINQSKANCYDTGRQSGQANPLNLTSEPYTSPVDFYPSYGYGMNDMAGNVYEWTSTVSDFRGKSYRILCGGSWDFRGGCSFSDSRGHRPDVYGSDFGFRVVNAETKASFQETAALVDQNEADKATAELKALCNESLGADDITQIQALIKA